MGQKKQDEAELKKVEARKIRELIETFDKDAFDATLESGRNKILLRLPNLPHPSVARGNSADYQDEGELVPPRRVPAAGRTTVRPQTTMQM